MVKLSVITVNLNNRDGLNKTIRSVINQTFTDYEYIVIDGGSIDGSIDVIKESEKKINYWVSEPDNGIYSAMNKGIHKARGEYLLFLNSGDWLVNNEVLFKVFKESQTADIIYGHMHFASDGKLSLRRAAEEHQLSLSYFFNNSLCHPATFIARRLFDCRLYDDGFRISADKKFFIEQIILNDCSIQRIDEIISIFNTSGMSYRLENKIMLKEENERIFTQLMPVRMIKDIELFKSNYPDILSLVKIKKYKILYFAFKGLKMSTTLFQKYFPLAKS
jgi:glycosyltransferase involved in cell wall biosynthesis